MSESLFGGKTTSVDELAKLIKDLKTKVEELQGDSNQTRSANPLADAIKVNGHCPAGLIGCNASELYTKTGGELTCPPESEAPDPFIIDGWGRVCYAPESIEKEWKGKDLNIHSLIRKYSEKLVKLLSENNNLQIAVADAAQNKGNSLIITNFFANNPQVANDATALGITSEALAAYLSNFSKNVLLDASDLLTNSFDNSVVPIRQSTSQSETSNVRRAASRPIDNLLQPTEEGTGRFQGGENLAGGKTGKLDNTELLNALICGLYNDPKQKVLVDILDTFAYITKTTEWSNGDLSFLPNKLKADVFRDSFFDYSMIFNVLEVFGTKTSTIRPKKYNNLLKSMYDRYVSYQKVLFDEGVMDSLLSKEQKATNKELSAKGYTQSVLDFVVYMQALFKSEFLSNTTRLFDLKLNSLPLGDQKTCLQMVLREIELFQRNLSGDTTQGYFLKINRMVDKSAELPQIKEVVPLDIPADGDEVKYFNFNGEALEQNELGGGKEIADVTSWDDMAEFMLSGGASDVPQHRMPTSVQKQLEKSEPKVPSELQKVYNELEKKGIKVATVYSGKTCPTYVKETGNTWGSGEERGWVTTKHPWNDCVRQMGMQFVSEGGYCYPFGMTCYPEDDVVTATRKTVRAADTWLKLASVFNSVQQAKLDQFLASEKSRIRAERPNLTDKEIEEIAKSHIPADLKGVSGTVALKSNITLSQNIRDAVSEISKTSDAKHIETLKQILRDGQLLTEQWIDNDSTAERQKLSNAVNAIFEDTKECTKITLDTKKSVTVSELAGQLEANKPVKCDVQSIGVNAEDVVLIPSTIKARIDEEDIVENDGKVDPIVQWWTSYYAEQAKKDLEKREKLYGLIAPFQEIPKHTIKVVPRPQIQQSSSAEEQLRLGLRSAVDRKGRDYLNPRI